ncbi:MAG: amidohydrolase family protein [Clostridia bacterium]|nr:amidohydrolase family protein [Clostridia bacterium]
MLAIINAQIVLENEILENGVLLVEDGKILNYGKAYDIEVPNGAEIFDANGLYVGPGFVDIHCHGGNNCRFDTEPVGAANYFLTTGTTTVLPTFYTDITPDEYIDAIDRVITAIDNGLAKNIGGFYMEGPYTNEKFGASPEKNRWRGEIKAEDYEKVVERAGKYAKVWVIAPERMGIEPFLKKVNEVNPNVTISVGHSEATPSQIREFKKYGLRLLTHCTDATGRLPCPAGTRNCGPDEACFLDDDMYAEVICDSQGIHVNPDMLKLILKIKGKERIILISDSFVSDEPSPKEFAHIKDLNFDANGGLCGSNLTLNVACANMMKHTSASINDVFLMASRNGARAIGLDKEIGTIEVGKKANLVIVNKEFQVKKVILEGEFVC